MVLPRAFLACIVVYGEMTGQGINVLLRDLAGQTLSLAKCSGTWYLYLHSQQYLQHVHSQQYMLAVVIVEFVCRPGSIVQQSAN